MRAYPDQALRILVLLLGWVGMWFLVEGLVIWLSPLPGRPLWLIFHLGYLLATSFWEAAIVKVAVDHFDGRPPGFAVLTDYRLALRFLIVKMILLPVCLIGIAAAVVPGLYFAARFGLAPFFVVGEGCGPFSALGRAGRSSRGHRPRLMLLCLLLLILNLLGAALFGLGLLFTLPVTALAGALVLRRLGTNAAAV